MALEGEITWKRQITCTCLKVLDIKVLRSPAGYYIGFFCSQCGPYSRESGYYPTEEIAEYALKTDNYGR